MNPDLKVTNATSSPQIQNPKSKIENVIRSPSGHKRNGKIAHLPKAVRDKINQWIDDGHTYPQIIKDLGDDAKDLTPRHFSEWRKGGYQDYLRHHEWRDQLRILRENGSDMSELTDGPKFQETLVQIALTEIFRVLEQGELKPDSLNYIRLFNALARLNREALGLRKYNDLLAKQQAELKQLDINREISENEHLAIVDRTDRIFEMPRPRRPEGTATRAASGVSSERSTASSVSPHGVTASAGPAPAEVSPFPRGKGGGEENRDVQQPDPCPIENRKSKIENSSRPLPSRPCRAETPDPAQQQARASLASLSASGGEGHGEVAQPSLSSSSSSSVPPIQNRKSKIKNPLSPLPSRPCQAETSPSPRGEGKGEGDSTVLKPNAQRGKRTRRPATAATRSIQNPKSKIENCLECRAALPPVPPSARRRPDDHCPSCGVRLPDMGLCYKPGFDRCLNCGATQPALLPGGERPRPHCHKCGERLHNPEPPMA